MFAIGLLSVFADCRFNLLHQFGVFNHATILLESSDADTNGSGDLVAKVSPQFWIAKRHPNRFRNLNIDCDVALLLREPESRDPFRPERLNRSIDPQDKAILVNRITMGARHMPGKRMIEVNLADSNRTRLWPTSLASYGDEVGHIWIILG